MADDPVLIKKYSNRKLYDPSRSRYITLEEIAGLIRQGKQVKVVDTTSHEDLTAVTLAQIILEEEKKHKNLVPVSFLHQLIQYGESFQHLFQRGVSSSLETFMTTQREAGKLWEEVAMRGWMPPGWKLDRARTTPAKQTEQTAEALLKAELELLKESLERLERRITDSQNRPAWTP
ncbi:MAG: polyhydroxyalkanoate synthesis regulator DNA-binding domain-containing protein [candidate division NC10 bacterium]